MEESPMNVEAVRRTAMQALRPPPTIATADWIEQHIHLPQSASSLPGRMRLWSYQRGILDAFDDPEIEKITVQKSARIGYTALLSGIIAASVKNAPAPILAVQPTADDARDFAVDVEAIMEASPGLRDLLSDEADESGRSTMMNRRFPGGALRYRAAKSPRALRRISAKVLIADEIDGFDVTAEGDPMELAVMRTQTFRDRKIVAGSTPIFDHGAISRLYAQSDMRIFEVPCPSCGSWSEIRWADIRWPEGNPDAAHWVCPTSGCVIEEREKPAMVAAGRWTITRPEVRGHAGFRINSLVSPHANASWGRLAQEFLAAKAAPETLQTFTNLVLGEPWRAAGEELDEAALFGRAEAIGLDPVPASVLSISVGVDVQRDRLEAAVIGWTENGQMLVLHHAVIWGGHDEEATWAELDALLTQRWPHALGGRIGVDACAVDAGDGVSMPDVTAFCGPRFRRRVVAIKGAPGASRPAIARANKVKGKALLWIVGVDGLKTSLFARLPQAGSVRFSNSLPEIWFEQLASERAVVRYVRGQPQRQFTRIPGRRAEALDAVIYAMAARALFQINPDDRRAALSRAEVPPAAPQRAVLRSRWMTRD